MMSRICVPGALPLWRRYAGRPLLSGAGSWLVPASSALHVHCLKLCRLTALVLCKRREELGRSPLPARVALLELCICALRGLSTGCCWCCFSCREEELERLREANKREKKRRKKGAAAFFDDD